MSLEVYDNATSPGTLTYATAVIEPSDLIIRVGDVASQILQTGKFRILVINTVTGGRELMMVIGGQNTPVWQVERGIEGTSPLQFPTFSVVKHVITAGALDQISSTARGTQIGTRLGMHNLGAGVVEGTFDTEFGVDSIGPYWDPVDGCHPGDTPAIQTIENGRLVIETIDGAVST
jgi:hypothetical protein